MYTGPYLGSWRPAAHCGGGGPTTELKFLQKIFNFCSARGAKEENKL